MSNDCEEVEEWEKTEEEQRVLIIDYLYFNRNTKDSGSRSVARMVNIYDIASSVTCGRPIFKML